MRMIPDEETVETLMEMGGEDKSLFNMCYQCGTCTGTCPWGLVKSFVVRKIMHKAQLGLIDFDDEEIWTCATCGACVTICPRGVEIIDVMRSFRNVVAELGVAKVPDSLRLSVKNIQGVGNPQGEPTDKRGKWADEAGIKAFIASPREAKCAAINAVMAVQKKYNLENMADRWVQAVVTTISDRS